MPNYLYLNGIPSETPNRAGEPSFAFSPQGTWIFSINNGLSAVETSAVELHSVIEQVLFKDLPYYGMLPYVPTYVATLGHNSEAAGSKSDFEMLLSLTKEIPELHRFLYLYDCQRLVSAIQECCKEIIQIQGEFYKTLNLEPFFYPVMQHENSIRYSTSPVITKLFAYLSFIFIRMHSLLDYTVKLAMEVQNLRNNFNVYPRMHGRNTQYGNRKVLKLNKKHGTLFEECDFLATIETLRNHIIHNGLLDDMPKGYEEIVNGVVTEKYLLMPDMADGQFEKYSNRNLFYGREDKINLRLPFILTEFMNRQATTLQIIIEDLKERHEL